MSIASVFKLACSAIALCLLANATVQAVPTIEYLDRFRTSPLIFQSTLIEGSDGSFYGTSTFGGAWNQGTVFKMDPAGMVTTLVDFEGTNGATPSQKLLQAGNGKFYGTTSAGLGTVFEITSGGEFRTIHIFDGTTGQTPNGGLIQAVDGNLYGTCEAGGANNGGTVFKITPDGNVSALASFNMQTGAAPKWELVQGNDGYLYGATSVGTVVGKGAFFKVSLTGTLSVVTPFPETHETSTMSSLALDSDGNFYGINHIYNQDDLGYVFKITATGSYTRFGRFPTAEKRSPFSGLTRGTDGNLYGTTVSAFLEESPPTGTVYRVTPNGAITHFATFTSDRAFLVTGALCQGKDGDFYGASAQSGPGGSGTLFKVKQSGEVTRLVAFFGEAGAYPTAELFQGADGLLYGTTSAGGSQGNGTVFRYRSGAQINTIATFGGLNGKSPSGGLVGDENGNLYGTTRQGGSADKGTIFKLSKQGDLVSLFSFSGTDGSAPTATMAIGTNGDLYGTTSSGGASNKGTLFKITPDGQFTHIHSFASAEGVPEGSIKRGPDGNFYGSTQAGEENLGTFFRVTPEGLFTPVTGLNGLNAIPAGQLAFGPDGNLYGTTFASGGIFENGTAFRITPAGVITTLYHFDSRVLTPVTGLTLGGDGNFYGLGLLNSATRIYRITPQGTFTLLKEFEPVGFSYNGLTLGADGHLYGLSMDGNLPTNPTPGTGIIFRFLLGPSVKTLPAGAIGGTYADLCATINPAGLQTAVSYHYGTSPVLGSFSILQAGVMQAGEDAIDVTSRVTGLAPGTTYYYRAVGANAQFPGGRNGEIHRFTTPAGQDIAVDDGAGRELTSGATLPFSIKVPNGTPTFTLVSPVEISLTLRNTHPTLALSGITALIGGPDGADFQIFTPPFVSLAGNSSGPTTCIIRFFPIAIPYDGSSTATLYLFSNDPDENPFTLILKGETIRPLDAWRQQHFHSTATYGPGSLTANADGDSLPNLLEYAFGTDPTLSQSNHAGTNGSVAIPGTPVVRTSDQRAIYARRKNPIFHNLIYTPQFSNDLTIWHDGAAAPVTAAADAHDEIEVVTLELPTLPSGGKARFFRVKVEMP